MGRDETTGPGIALIGRTPLGLSTAPKHTLGIVLGALEEGEAVSSIPFDTWGLVTAVTGVHEIEKLKVVSAGGVLLLTVEKGRQYDTWHESLADIEADLAALEIHWLSAVGGEG